MPIKCKIMAEKQDIAMNAFKVLTDVMYVYGEASDSSQGKIKKSDLLNAMFQKGSLAQNANDLVQTGIYRGGNIENAPSNDVSAIIVFNASPYIIHFCLAMTTGRIYYRRSVNNGESWYSWLSINTTAV